MKRKSSLDVQGGNPTGASHTERVLEVYAMFKKDEETVGIISEQEVRKKVHHSKMSSQWQQHFL